MPEENGHVNKSFDKVPENLDEIKPDHNGVGEIEPPSFEAVDESMPTRASWDKPIEFLMSCIAMNVGLGNIWRFPFVAYENGGGAFLIPYVIVLLLMGRPMYYLEACLGQFVSRGNVKMFENLAPALKGIGFGQLTGTVCVATYYCYLMAITLFYLANSFTSDLPWAVCRSEWETVDWVKNQNVSCIPSNSEVAVNTSNMGVEMSSAELFFRINVLKESSDISNGLGAPDWQLTLCLLGSWIVTFAVGARGIQSSGKASYFLAIFPYVVLFALLIRSVTLDGSGTGILYFINPKWDMLLNAKVWYNAVTQCFFSLNIGFGSISMYASYSGFRHNVYRDAMIVTTLDTCTSILAGTIIFGILGNLALKMNVEVSDVVKSGGTGLAFISYPEAIAKFEAVPWLFSILFFVMLFVLGVGSLIALQGCAFTVIMDAFPHLKIWHVSLGTAVGGFIVGLVYVTPGGQWIFTMVDFYCGTFIFYIMNILSIIAIVWWYGLENLCLDIEFMTKNKPGVYWRICWLILVPIVLILVLIYFLVTFEALTYEKKEFPANIIVWGWILLGFGICQPLIWFIFHYFVIRKDFESSKLAISSMFKHTDWGPKDAIRHRKWTEFKTLKKADRKMKLRNRFKDKLCILIGK
ncbi:sodium-dependent nutrient amino acid transporter 1-like [Anthonomus grandis grandis]|uniref:sodium-dependent nutrient amino acid transporter 1-like n=1 Tax=Anthonomus grandis grandis TaxID=2921223 RepID=UPI0021663931|nr:sodium-dependent nutrient amino acid transporter 1-like [Anthonomus grandis grandis]